jgi:DNA-binding LacI/PurR family transcriptional regulator
VWINSKQPADCVYPDDFQGAVQATNYLLSLGHERIAFVCFYPNSHYSYIDRIAGYETAMRSAGRTPQTIVDYRGRKVSSETFADLSWLQGDDRVTAVLAYSDGLLLYEAALQGLRTPEHFSLIVFSGSYLNDMGPHITLIQLPDREIGQTAARMLLEKMESPELPLEPHPLPLVLREGESCRTRP